MERLWLKKKREKERGIIIERGKGEHAREKGHSLAIMQHETEGGRISAKLRISSLGAKQYEREKKK